MGPILYFKGGSEVAAAISAKDLMIAAGDDAVEFYTFGEKKQKISIAVTDGTSADTVKLLADALADLRGINGGAIVTVAAFEELVKSSTTIYILLCEANFR